MWESAQRELWKLDFPECTERALHQIKQHFVREFTSRDSIPGLGGPEEVSGQIVEDFIFVHSSQNRHSRQGRSGMQQHPSLQELRSLEIILNTYKELERDKVPDGVSFSLFQVLFWRAASDRQRMNTLSKLVSLAVSLGYSLVLHSAALWMQLQGVQSSSVQNIIQSLITDHCGTTDNKLENLPQLSQHFACILISTAVILFKHPGEAGKPQNQVFYDQLLPMMTSWIVDDPHLCLISLVRSQHVQTLVQPHRATLWTSPTKPNTQTPIPGLVRWATQGPLTNLLNQASDSPSGDNFQNENRLSDLHTTWSKLHLGILQIVSVFSTMPGANQLEMITLVDMKHIVEELVVLLPWEQTSDNQAQTDVIDTCLDRMIQILQLTLATGAFRCSLADLKTICSTLPETNNRLKRILENQHLSNNPPAMHDAS